MSARPRYWVNVPATHPDAQLINLCNEANHNHSRTSRLPLDAPAIPTSVGEWHRLVERIIFTPASTPEGIRAKAEVLAPVAALDGQMVASLVSDIIGRKVGDLTAEGRRRYMRNHIQEKRH